MSKRTLKCPLVIAAALVICGPARGATTELIENGSFETPELAAGTFRQLPSIPGWSGTAGTEVQNNGSLAGVETPFGEQYAELSVESASTYSQTVTTVPGERYQLSFYLAARPGTGDTSVSVAFDGQESQVFTVEETGGFDFQQFTLSLTANDDESVVSFTPTRSRGAGDLLDNVSLTSVTGGGNGGAQPIPLPPGVWTGLGTLFALTAPRALRRWRASRMQD